LFEICPENQINDGQAMLAECFNVACRRELRYLRSGRIIRVLRQGIDRVEIEHFWLCGACYVSYDFCFVEDGKPSLTKKSTGQAARELDHCRSIRMTCVGEPSAFP